MVSYLGFAISAEDMQILMQENTTAVWEQWQLFQISSGAILDAPLGQIEAVPPAA